MKLRHYAEGGEVRSVAGPGDLAGERRGYVLLDGSPDDTQAAYWAVPLGLFAARGGEIRWRQG